MSKNLQDEEDTNSEYTGYMYYEQTHYSKTHHFYLSSEIGPPNQYVDMIYKITTADPVDVVIIHINTPGGDLSTGCQLINAMQSSSAHIITSLEGEACSLGSLIFLAGTEFVTHDNSILMIHNYSGGTFGKANEQALELSASIEWFNSLARTHYVPFISEGELESMLNGTDMWLQTPDIRKRLNKMVKIREKEWKALNKSVK